MNPYIEAHKADYNNAIDRFRQDLAHIRTGQANPELVEGLLVNSYDSMTPLKQLASISIPEPKLIVIQPWDKSILKEIEKTIINANMGFSPVNDGEVIRVPMPALTEENRRDLVKLVKEKTEKCRISLRQVRDKVKKSIDEAEKEKQISEDDRFKFLKELDEYTSERVKEVDEISSAKEEKIMTV